MPTENLGNQPGWVFPAECQIRRLHSDRSGVLQEPKANANELLRTSWRQRQREARKAAKAAKAAEKKRKLEVKTAKQAKKAPAPVAAKAKQAAAKSVRAFELVTQARYADRASTGRQKPNIVAIFAPKSRLRLCTRDRRCALAS